MIVAVGDLNGKLGFHPYRIKHGNEIPEKVLKAMGGKAVAIKAGIAKEISSKATASTAETADKETDK